MIHLILSEQIKQQITAMLHEQGIQPDMDIAVQIEHPTHPEHGDFSTNIAMLLAKVFRQSPIQLAGRLQQKLEQQGSVEGLFAQIKVAPPGFLNFYIDWQAWATRKFAAPKASQTKVLIEHTSINPNKSAHIGHLRNSCIGDALAHMLEMAGHQVEVHNYIDDLGNQLADTVVGMLNTHAEQPHTRFGDYCWDTYAGINQAYKVNPELQAQRTAVLEALEQGNSNLAWMGSLVAERIVAEQLEEMKQFGIRYDVLVWESNIVREGFWAAAFELLQQTDVFQKVTMGKHEGCWVLKQQDEPAEGFEHSDYQIDKVLVRSNGILTYTAKDIAYHLWKFGLLDNDFTYKKFAGEVWSTHPQGVKRKIGHADMVINVIDQRQQYPQQMVKLALEVLGFTKQAAQLKHVSYGVVSLSPITANGLGVDTTEGKAAYAMSGRQGIGIKVADLLDRMEQTIYTKRKRKQGLASRTIAAAAIRYYLLKYHLQTEVIFDLEQATEVSGNSGVYLLYAYARANSILEKATDGPSTTTKTTEMPRESVRINSEPLMPQELQLLRQLAYWPETFQLAVDQLAPNLICNYAFELAALFNNFYSVCPILKAPEDKVALRLWITQQFKETLHQALQALGMPTPKRM
ncbi:arginine--tRNA ligase [Paenibacillus agricola]|uniref:Arginine--tRNA ligase n=1 Tax=Paenibacillus agricola TaxID=2716264 RepID=A0ABX0IYS2_9BACL|nr:arginine--tRNA ligase [Paenibacillus agricola]NHN28276.1 arginine--tRNA ligase [Paenibacillus agricola]